MYKYLASLSLLFLSLFIAIPVFAETLVLTHIGAMETKGVKYNQWWYEPQQIKLKGTGSKSANIDITVDGKFNTIKSDITNGAWSYDLGTMTVADHSIIIGSGEESYSFILTVGSPQPKDMKGTTKGGLPEAGVLFPLIGMTASEIRAIFLPSARSSRI